MTSSAKPSASPNHSAGLPRADEMKGANTATRIGCNAMMIAVVPAFIPRFMAR